MFKKNFYLAFVLMLISIFLLTTIPTYASAEEPYETNYTPKKTTTKKRTTKKRKTNSRSSQKKSLGYPKWISWRWKLNIIRNEDEDNQNSTDYYKFKIAITYTNKSQDKIIKCFFNRNLNVSFDHCLKRDYSGEIKYKGKYYDKISHCQSNEISYSKPIKCNLYPGESYTQTYYVPFSRFNWKKRYDSRVHGLINYKISHKFQVQKENMDNVE